VYFLEKTKSLIPIALISMTLTLVLGCSEDKKAPKPPQFIFQSQLKVSEPSSLEADKKAVYKSIQEKKPLDFKTLTKLFETFHLDYYNENKSPSLAEKSYQNDLKDILKDINNKSDLDVYALKLQAESAVSSKTGEPVDYVFESNTIPDIFSDSSLQCYSGTSLFEVVARRHYGNDNYHSLNRVIIFEPGHVLPGFMVKVKNRWRLYGVEMTVSGRGMMDFGWTDEIKLPIRVVDANHWIVTEIFQEDLDPKQIEPMATDILEYTAQRYNLSLKTLEAAIESSSKSTEVIETSKGVETPTLASNYSKSNQPTVINSSFFSFGSADVPTNRQTRTYQDEVIPRGDVEGENPCNLVSPGLNTLICRQDSENEKDSEENQADFLSRDDLIQKGYRPVRHSREMYGKYRGVPGSMSINIQWEKKGQPFLKFYASKANISDLGFILGEYWGLWLEAKVTYASEFFSLACPSLSYGRTGGVQMSWPFVDLILEFPEQGDCREFIGASQYTHYAPGSRESEIAFFLHNISKSSVFFKEETNNEAGKHLRFFYLIQEDEKGLIINSNP
jgi:hypothetical protein